MLKNYSAQKRKELNLLFLEEEPLFNFVDSNLDEIENIFRSKETSKIENWTDAKTIIASMCRSKTPHKMVNITISGLFEDVKSFCTAKRGEPHHTTCVHAISS